MEFKLGVCQFKPILKNTKVNLNKMLTMAEAVDADLIVFPELATSGYVFKNRDEVMALAEPFQKGSTYKTFSELAIKKNCAYVIGFPENDNGVLYNSSMLINPDGSSFLYRKIHLFAEEKRWFESGDLGFTVAETKNRVKIGLMICFDWIFPEAARTCMKKGAHIIAHSANLVMPWCQQAMITRSIENRLFIATANRTGKEINEDKDLFFTGKSQITNVDGSLFFRLDEEEETIRIETINPLLSENKQVNPWNNINADLKPDYYL